VIIARIAAIGAKKIASNKLISRSEWKITSAWVSTPLIKLIIEEKLTLLFVFGVGKFVSMIIPPYHQILFIKMIIAGTDIVFVKD
jgi:hypothetical protein